MSEEMNTLIVRHLPAELNPSEQEDLLCHFGASHVRCMGNKGRMKHVAFAVFPDHEAATQALERLHQLQVLGSKLVVEYSKPQDKKYHPMRLESHGNKNKKETDDNQEDKIASKQFSEVDMKKVTDNINALAPKWSLNYAFNPNLMYMYPPPSVSILTNIANTLASVPKFYVQVLHLMNKFNLPAPFGPITPTPPLPEGDPLPPPPPFQPTEPAPPCPVDSVEQNNIVEAKEQSSTEESEIESDEETDKQAPRAAVKRPMKDPNKPRKKARIQSIIPSIPIPGKPKGPATRPEEVFEQPSTVGPKKIEFRFASGLPEGVPAVEQAQHENSTDVDFAVALPDLLTVTEPVEPVVEGGFGKMEPAPKIQEEAEDNEEEEEWGATEFISSRKLRRGRISSSEMKDLSVFRNYQSGEPTSRLYIKNLARQVTEKDLHYVYGRYVNWDIELEKNMFDIRLMKEGRMKGQAFITLPNPEVAKEALKDTNGFVMHGKPMVVQFARSAKPKEK